MAAAVFINVNETEFTLNGIPYDKVFFAKPTGTASIQVTGVYEGRNRILESTPISDISVDGTTYVTVAALIAALKPVLYNRESSSGGGGGTSQPYLGKKAYSLNLNGITITDDELEYVAKAINRGNGTNPATAPAFTSASGQEMIFETRTVQGEDQNDYRIIIRKYSLYSMLTSVGGASSGSLITKNDIYNDGYQIIQVGSSNNDELVIHYGEIGTTPIEDKVNEGDENGEAWNIEGFRVFDCLRSGELFVYIFIGPPGLYGGDDLGDDPDILEAFPEHFQDITDQPTVTVDINYLTYQNIAAMLAAQSLQTSQNTLWVKDASADTNIVFPIGETRKQAFYKLKGDSETGTMADYELISAPYGIVRNEIPLIIKVKTDNVGASDDTQFTIYTNSNFDYNYNVVTSDGQSFSGVNGNLTIDFPEAGEYEIEIRGVFPHFVQNTFYEPLPSKNTPITVFTGDEGKLIDVMQFGNISFKSMEMSFVGCVNLTNFSATDAPNLKNCTSLSHCFSYSSFNGNINHWDVGNIESLRSTFKETPFNQPLDKWNVSRVKSLRYTFYGCEDFNQNINNWNVASVVSMQAAFRGCSSFNQPLDRWVTSSCKNFHRTFNGCTIFNQNINTWDVEWADDFSSMFGDCVAFNQSLESWDLRRATYVSGMMMNCSAFNQPVNNWRVSMAIKLDNLFYGCSSFNQPLDLWDTSNVKSTLNMFFGCTVFNGDVSTWELSSAISLEGMFNGCSSFNGDISNWDVSGVKNMKNMFSNASSFNGDISGWNVGKVTTMESMFSNCSSFNGDISGWNVENVTNMNAMFSNCSSFNGDISGWNVENVVDMYRMFYRCTVFNADISGWNVENVTDMNAMFRQSAAFNADISGWNVSNVTDMFNMFYGCLAFSADLSTWNVANVTTMNNMFRNASNFDSDLSSWNVENVTDFAGMFDNVTLSTVNYDALLIAWSELNLQLNKVFSGGNSQYSAGAAASARQKIIDDFNWTISDGGPV